MSATTHQQQIEAGLRAVFTEGAGAMSLIVPGDGGRGSCVNDTQPNMVGYAVLSPANVPGTASGVRWRD